MKVFLDGEEDSFLLHKVENYLVVTQFPPLSIIHRGGLFEVGVHSEADNHKLAGRERSEHQDCVECGLGVENLGKEMGPDNLGCFCTCDMRLKRLDTMSTDGPSCCALSYRHGEGHQRAWHQEAHRAPGPSAGKQHSQESHRRFKEREDRKIYGETAIKVSNSDDLRVQLFTSLFTFVYMSEEK